MRSEKIPIGKSERTFVDVARRAQLVECAIDAIAELGLPKASLAEVARRAGVTKTTIFYHFANREELILEVFASTLAQGGEFMAARTGGAESAAAELRAYIEANVQYIGTHRKHVRVLTEIAMNFTDEDGRTRLTHDASVYGTSLAPLQDLLERGQRAGEFRDFTTRTTAMTIRAAIDAIGPQLTVIPDLDLDAYAADLVSLFRHATERQARP
ncbi:TetR/AcrR family transcriptional regulator [Umezawaea tangerina]|uniref:TetR family transcriptional regulator n=1 Tax=Umezawaea tangerina TaxID=84725 RepID=A0A2T0SMY7_9PSEU|nr:TetR/AcrR family transcriptional regulator [Umezawaea tangerina]PRY34779.1 TetR family transcriptional regulator [Umezawaea tangerina]